MTPSEHEKTAGLGENVAALPARAGGLLRRVRVTARLVAEPMFTPPGHYYSPVSDEQDAQRAKAQREQIAAVAGVDLHSAEQLRLAEQIGPDWAEFPSSWRRYEPNNWFVFTDGAVYYSMLRHFTPKRVIEVGSGYSSAVALDVRDAHLRNLELTFIEPNTQRLMGLIDGNDSASTTLHQQALQDVSLDVFDSLDAGDFLFIDSTHVGKAGSDVNWLFFVVLPRLKPGVHIHIHDIFFPFEYPDVWLDERRSWNEAYMLRCFLAFNSQFRIELFSSWLWQAHPEVIRRHLPGREADLPGSIWLTKTG